jgi:hypothetical protein
MKARATMALDGGEVKSPELKKKGEMIRCRKNGIRRPVPTKTAMGSYIEGGDVEACI